MDLIKRGIDLKRVENIFGNWQETIIWSCLQGILGEVYVDDKEKPTSAMAMLGDFAFFAGEPKEDLVLYKPEGCNKNFIIMVPQNDGWSELIERCYREKAKKVTRYATKKEPYVFNKEKLKCIIAGLSKEYTIELINKDIYEKCKAENWSRDLVSQYKNYDMYKKYGLGVAILRDDKLISGASSYSSYKDGIEIEIDTKEEYRRKGLAYVCGAKLILEALERNLYPSWDAQNKWSVALAEKLGYNYSHEYTAYEIWDY